MLVERVYESPNEDVEPFRHIGRKPLEINYALEMICRDILPPHASILVEHQRKVLGSDDAVR